MAFIKCYVMKSTCRTKLLPTLVVISQAVRLIIIILVRIYNNVRGTVDCNCNHPVVKIVIFNIRTFPSY